MGWWGFLDRERCGGAARRQSRSALATAKIAQKRGRGETTREDGGRDKQRANLTAAQKSANTRTHTWATCSTTK
eukprot:2667575-Pyramimonas_sp.AAC.1